MSIIVKGVASYPNVFEAKTNPQNPNATPKFSLTILVDKNTEEGRATMAAYKKQLDLVAREKCKKPYADVYIPDDDRKGFLDGDGKAGRKSKTGEKIAGYEGMWVIKASSADRIAVVDHQRKPLVAQDGKVYGGCIVKAVINPYYTENGGSAGFFNGLEAVQVVGSGQRFGRAPVDVNSVFAEEEYEGDEDLPHDDSDV